MMLAAEAPVLPLLVDLLDVFRDLLLDVAQITSHHILELLPQELILLLVAHMQLRLLDIVDVPLVVVGTDVLVEVKLDAWDERVLFELHRIVIEEVEQPEVGHILPVLLKVLPPDGDGVHELHLAPTFHDDDQAGVGGWLGEKFLSDEG